MTMSRNPHRTAGRRTITAAEQNRDQILRLLAEHGDGKSQNEIYQALADSTNWTTIRRDLRHLRENNMLSTTLGARGAILHSLTLRGVITYLSKCDYHIPTYRIPEPGEDEETAKQNLLTDLNLAIVRIRKLQNTLEREGNRLRFPLFSEIKNLTKKFDLQHVIRIIVNVSQSLLTSKFFLNISAFVSQQRKRKRELEKFLQAIDEYPSLRKSVIFHEVDGARIETTIDNEENAKSEIDQLTNTIDHAWKSEETRLLNTFTEQFFERFYPLVEHSNYSIPNDKLHSSVECLVSAKQREYERIQAISAMFA